MTLKAPNAEFVLSPAELRLEKARTLYVRLATEKERLSCDVAILRLESAKRSTEKNVERKIIRAEGDLTDAQTKLLEATERAVATFEAETKV